MEHFPKKCCIPLWPENVFLQSNSQVCGSAKTEESKCSEHDDVDDDAGAIMQSGHHLLLHENNVVVSGK